MKGDGHVGGCQLLGRRGTAVKIQASKTDNHFISLTVTSLTGQPALCVVIFKS